MAPKGYKSQGTNIAFEEGGSLAHRLKKESVVDEPVYVSEKEVLSYYPTRLEYMAGKALQGLVTGRSERDLASVVRKAVMLAEEMEVRLDSKKD